MKIIQIAHLFVVTADTPDFDFSRTESNCRIGTASFDISTCYAQVRIKAMFEKEYNNVLEQMDVHNAVQVEGIGSLRFFRVESFDRTTREWSTVDGRSMDPTVLI